jgi:hypothetical protein
MAILAMSPTGILPVVLGPEQGQDAPATHGQDARATAGLPLTAPPGRAYSVAMVSAATISGLCRLGILPACPTALGAPYGGA